MFLASTSFSFNQSRSKWSHNLRLFKFLLISEKEYQANQIFYNEFSEAGIHACLCDNGKTLSLYKGLKIVFIELVTCDKGNVFDKVVKECWKCKTASQPSNLSHQAYTVNLGQFSKTSLR